jgi:hypothetical protein
MSIFTALEKEEKPVPVFDKAAEITRIVENIKLSSNATSKVMLQTYKNNFTAIWKNLRITPQEIFDAFGTDARELFIAASGIASVINAIKPNTITEPVPYEYTINEDGTVKIGEKKNAE